MKHDCIQDLSPFEKGTDFSTRTEGEVAAASSLASWLTACCAICFRPNKKEIASYRNLLTKWWTHEDLNLGRTGYEPGALPTELWVLSVMK